MGILEFFNIKLFSSPFEKNKGQVIVEEKSKEEKRKEKYSFRFLEILGEINKFEKSSLKDIMRKHKRLFYFGFEDGIKELMRGFLVEAKELYLDSKITKEELIKLIRIIEIKRPRIFKKFQRIDEKARERKKRREQTRKEKEEEAKNIISKYCEISEAR